MLQQLPLLECFGACPLLARARHCPLLLIKWTYNLSEQSTHTLKMSCRKGNGNGRLGCTSNSSSRSGGPEAVACHSPSAGRCESGPETQHRCPQRLRSSGRSSAAAPKVGVGKCEQHSAHKFPQQAGPTHRLTTRPSTISLASKAVNGFPSLRGRRAGAGAAGAGASDSAAATVTSARRLPLKACALLRVTRLHKIP